MYKDFMDWIRSRVGHIAMIDPLEGAERFDGILTEGHLMVMKRVQYRKSICSGKQVLQSFHLSCSTWDHCL